MRHDNNHGAIYDFQVSWASSFKKNIRIPYKVEYEGRRTRDTLLKHVVPWSDDGASSSSLMAASGFVHDVPVHQCHWSTTKQTLFPGARHSRQQIFQQLTATWEIVNISIMVTHHLNSILSHSPHTSLAIGDHDGFYAHFIPTGS